jgi:hypothetical protein
VVNDVSNVVSGKPLATGGIWGGPLGTALPADEAVALNAALKAYGYIGEDGLTETIGRSTEKVKAWGGDTVKVVQTDGSVTYQFTFIESMNAEVLKTVFGASNVTVTAATPTAGTKFAVKRNVSEQLAHQVFIFEIKDGPARKRIVVPDGQVTEVGDVTYNDGGVISYQVTVEAFFNPAIGGQSVEYSDNGKPSA